jgi:MFS family permease
MGAIGYLVSSRAVFLVTAAAIGPALIALSQIRNREIDPKKAHGGEPESVRHAPVARLLGSAAGRSLATFAACILMFQLANAAMLPLMGSVVTMRSRAWAPLLIAACIVVPQLLVALISPWVGRRAQLWGRRPLLLLGFAALPLRALLFATLPGPYLLVAAQVLDGASAAVLGIMGPLVVADLTRGTGRFNMGQGIIGTAVGIGASLSTTLAGYMSDHFGNEPTFLGLAGVAAVALALVFTLMPETRAAEND